MPSETYSHPAPANLSIHESAGAGYQSDYITDALEHYGDWQFIHVLSPTIFANHQSDILNLPVDFQPPVGELIRGHFRMIKLASGSVEAYRRGGAGIVTSPGVGSSGASSQPVMTNLKMWLKADAIVGLNDGDPVTTWEDSTTNDNDMVQNTAANKPFYKLNIQNGKPSVRFDGVDDGMLNSTLFVANMHFTIFCVYNYRSTTNAARRAIQGSGGRNWLIGPYGLKNANFASSQWISQVVDTVQNRFFLGMYTNPGGVSAFYLNGVNRTTNPFATTSGPGFLALGAAGQFPEPLDGDILEVLVYDFPLSDADRQFNESYLRTKWNLDFS